MPIPVLKLFDDIIAGIPLNSTQRIEIGKMKEQIAALEKENGELREQIAKLNSQIGIAKGQEDLIQLGNFYFKKGNDGKATGSPYCMNCWDSSQKMSKAVEMGVLNQWRCPACESQCRGGGFGWPRSF